jgi:hypothetical protein
MRKITKLMMVGLATVTLGATLPLGSAQASQKATTPIPTAIRGSWKSVKHPKTRQVYIAKDYYYLEVHHDVDFGLLHATGHKLSKNTYQITGYSYSSGKNGHGNRRSKITVQKKGHRIGIKGSVTGISAKHFTWFYK